MTDAELAEIEARWSLHASDCARDTAPPGIAALVAEVRRDECARILEVWTVDWSEGDSPFDLIGALAKAIRTRGVK